MPERTASRTAAFVAGLRGSCPYLPLSSQLVRDDFAFKLVPNTSWQRLLEFSPRTGRWLLRHGSYAHKAVMVLQLRTRGFDDAVSKEIRAGVSQVVILGAGYDARALRLQPSFPDTKFVEIDMPSSQKAKREALAVREYSNGCVSGHFFSLSLLPSSLVPPPPPPPGRWWFLARSLVSRDSLPTSAPLFSNPPGTGSCNRARAVHPMGLHLVSNERVS